VALDRQSIEKKDFPIGRRGYDPEAVDAHLTELAEEVTEFKRSARRRNDTLASSASDHVRAIVEAAESSAADIQREAETEAREIREEAASEVQTAREEAASEAASTREQAAEQAREYIGKVSESTASMLQRIDAMESELSSLIDTLRTSGNRLDSDLRLLEGNINEVSDAFSPSRRFEPGEETTPIDAVPEIGESPSALESEDAWGAPPDAIGDESSSNGLAEEGLVVEEAEIIVEVDEIESLPAAEPAGQAASSDDAEGARLIALNMALNGTPRDETAKYLTENFTLDDSDGLLDEVYASVEG
jgi:DivIVA domain-containing protein